MALIRLCSEIPKSRRGESHEASRIRIRHDVQQLIVIIFRLLLGQNLTVRRIKCQAQRRNQDSGGHCSE